MIYNILYKEFYIYYIVRINIRTSKRKIGLNNWKFPTTASTFAYPIKTKNTHILHKKQQKMIFLFKDILLRIKG